MEPNPPVPQVHDRRRKVLGALPRNAQNIVIGAVALLMMIVIVFSGHTPSKVPHTLASPLMPVTDPNRQSIQEYRARIEEQAQKLALEEADLARTKANMTPAVAPQAHASSSNVSALSASAADDGVWHEREKREYQSLFASNIALSYRKPTAENDRHPVTEMADNTAPAAVSPAISSPAQYRLFEGTIIEAVLTNRLDGSFSGPVNCMVTTNVYSPDQVLLIPQGARLLGEVHKVDSLGQQRLAVTFHRLLLPNGWAVSLDQFQGLDSIGETGLRDQVNHHYLQIFGVSLAIGAFAGLAQVNTRYSLDESAADAYEQGVASSFSQSALHILDRYLNVLPTFTIREGHRVKVYLSQDLTLPAYEQRAG